MSHTQADWSASLYIKNTINYMYNNAARYLIDKLII